MFPFNSDPRRTYNIQVDIRIRLLGLRMFKNVLSSIVGVCACLPACLRACVRVYSCMTPYKAVGFQIVWEMQGMRAHVTSYIKLAGRGQPQPLHSLTPHVGR